MPKQKTHKGLNKRVKVTARRKVKRRMSFSGHLLSGKSGGRLRRLRRPTLVHKRDTKRVLEALNA